MRSSRIQALALAALVGLGVTGCDELTQLTEGEQDSDLIGEWVAVSALLTNADGPGQVDLITDVGAFTGVTFHEAGAIAVAEYDPVAGELYEAGGTWSTSGNELTIHWDDEDEPETVTYQFDDAGHLIVMLPEGLEWDFDGDGTPEATEETFTFASAADSPDPDLVTTWTATSLVYTSTENPDVSEDVIQEAGETFVITFTERATYELDESWPDQGGTVESHEEGNYIALEGLMWVTQQDDDGPHFVFYTTDGAAATLAWGGDHHDFDGDDVDEPASVVVQLSSQ